MNARTFDTIIIGGGIVGMATAIAILRQSRARVCVLEAEDELASHQSGRNSGVIHSGLYYRPGSLKARLCVEGRAAMERFCTEHDIRFVRCGKIIVAATPAELARLTLLEERGRANGLDNLRFISSDELREIEPHARGLGALHVPQTGIVDFADVTRAMAVDVMRSGGDVRTAARAMRIDARDDEIIVDTPIGEFRAKAIIGCAGAQADRVAMMCGVEPSCRIVPFRGEYLQLVEPKRGLVRNPIYPVPDPALPFLGVHFTPTIHGEVEVGPNAVMTLNRGGYQRGLRGMVRLDDAMEAMTFSGFWRMASRNLRLGVGELARSRNRSMFIRSARRLVPQIGADDLEPGHTGIRAQAVNARGDLVDDFVIESARRQMHVLNAPSPAATASLAIGRFIADRAVEQFDLPRLRLVSAA